MSDNTWTPRTMGEVIRQGREGRLTLGDRLARAVGLEALRSRRARRAWERWRPYAFIGGVMIATLGVAAVKVL